MKPQKPPAQEPDGLFKTPLERFIDMRHPLVGLADRIDWEALDGEVAGCFGDVGRPAVPTRFILGMLILKAMNSLSDEALFDRWSCDPYFQHFTGEIYFQHRVPHERSGLSHWRNRLGADILDRLLRESLNVAQNTGALTKCDMEVVTVDTTVQEKAVRFPTDAALLYTALTKLGIEARMSGIKLRQSYVRVAKTAAMMAGRYAHAKHFKRMRRRINKLRTYVGRLIRDIRRKATHIDEELAILLDRAGRIRNQRTSDKKKLYSLHEPEVMCISKGKAHKRYEFGQKVSVTTTNRGNWIVGVNLCEGNPYDGHTLAKAIATTEQVTRVSVTDAYVDKGYRGNNYEGEAAIHISGSSTRRLTRTQKKRRRRRSAVEPKIGHLKSDNRMGRCFLKGLAGDSLNAVLAAAGSNLQKLLRAMAPALILWLWRRLEGPFSSGIDRRLPAAATI